MSIRTRATREEIATVELIYDAMNENKSQRKIFKGIVLSKKCHFTFQHIQRVRVSG